MLLATLLLLATPQAAPATDCPATPVALPAGMDGWRRPVSVTASADAARPAALTIGTAVTATLLPASRLAYAAPPAKPGKPGTHGGVLAFTVTRAGRYRVALGAGAWIDVLRGTTVVASVAHGHGPACSTIRKMVDFDLQPGRHLLQIAGIEPAVLTVMVVAMP
ncbi:homogentisate 1,2-dioxygenase [Sphingomonas sp. Leaf22]|uniref:hypothetical protein n=1 Tax=Sphingomonas sp. Leaf22 TaxID=1735687 RepID=UPI0006F3C692|nr:hypothetical protein [Sphingomonas sp. Leaf22]KQM88944.1 homogentisate 1,2-dioxygenase [Sphingomonas sp. Leaf22]